MIDVLVFDLDDTLYLEKDFVMSGYQAVARYLADSNVCDSRSAFSCMAETFATQGRRMAFSALAQKFPDAAAMIADLIEVYRQHSPAICLFPGYWGLLQEFAGRYRLGIITDGLPAVQERKVRALGLDGIMNKIIYTWVYGVEKEKPHPFSFSLMLESLRAEPDSALFIGDNPDKDCRGAHQAGMKCVQVQHPMTNKPGSGSKTVEQPEFVIDSLHQLPQILQHMN
jgi:putative hydrolase of the HAD superfamily